MLNTLMEQLIACWADMIAGTFVATAQSEIDRRAKLEEYRLSAVNHLSAASEEIANHAHRALRNRYAEWLEHPRLGHEALSAESHAADVGLHDAVVTMLGSPTPINQFLVTAACVRVAAITDVLGPDCVHLAAIGRPIAVRQARRPKAKRGGSDKRMSRRALKVDDFDDRLLPTLASLGANDPARLAAISELERLRGSAVDGMGQVTKLLTLAALHEHATHIDSMAHEAAARLQPTNVADSDHIASETGASPAALNESILQSEAIEELPHSQDITQQEETEEQCRQIDSVLSFCRAKTWAAIKEGERYAVRRLDTRKDINVAFAAVRDLPRMQSELRAIHVAANSGHAARDR